MRRGWFTRPAWVSKIDKRGRLNPPSKKRKEQLYKVSTCFNYKQKTQPPPTETAHHSPLATSPGSEHASSVAVIPACGRSTRSARSSSVTTTKPQHRERGTRKDSTGLNDSNLPCIILSLRSSELPPVPPHKTFPV